jgi:outer membrane protein
VELEKMEWISMTKTLLFSCFLAVSLAGGAMAQQLKVATLNLEKALMDTGEMKKEQAALEARYKPAQARITKLQGELAELQKQLQTMGDKLKPEVQQEMVASGQKKERDLQRLTDDLQQDVDRDRTEVLTRGRPRIEAAVKKVAEEKGLDLIVDANSIFYSKPTFDISAEVTAAYNTAYPVK